MTKSIITIPNISCGHCVHAIQSELVEMKGIISVSGDPANKKIEVQWSAPASLEAIKMLLKKINYPAAAD
ncbi:MAG: heavy metal-associated domain-containing protein [Desulfobacterales bacterium]|jgi:copper chaperone CopZ|nr:heavy metal-associated domain-containing protein [Desulfobacterales bacterium]